MTTDLGFRYHLDGRATASGADSNPGTGSTLFRPRLTVFVHLEDGVAVDAKLTPATREFLQKLALNNNAARGHGTLTSESMYLAPSSRTASCGHEDTPGHTGDIRQIEVPLTFDAEFFEILQTDVSNIGALQEEEQAKLEGQIVTLGEHLAKAVEPSRGRRAKADLEAWRHIFQLYLDARVFFSSQESDHGARTSKQAVEQLRWFQDQVVQRRLVQRLKLDTSRSTFDNFVNVNAALLSILKFQEINRLAVSKILKSTPSLTLCRQSSLTTLSSPDRVRQADFSGRFQQLPRCCSTSPLACR